MIVSHIWDWLVNLNFYRTQEFWTAAAVMTAILIPWCIEIYRNKPKKSKLVFEKFIITPNANFSDEHYQSEQILNVGRLAIKNCGKYKAKSVEAYIDRIVLDDGEVRKDFLPMPLLWTHGTVNAKSPTTRDIYPNQVVYLDIFNYILDDSVVNNNIVRFAFAAEVQYDNLSHLYVGRSLITVKLYQESGQVSTLTFALDYNGENTPKPLLPDII